MSVDHSLSDRVQKSGKHWNKFELQQLKEGCFNTKRPNWKALALKIGRTPAACSRAALQHGYYKSQSDKFRWTTEQKDEICRLCETGLYTLPEAIVRYRRICTKRGWAIRSKTSICRVISAAGLSFERAQLAEYLTIGAIATGLGYRSDFPVRSWVRTGRLPSKGGSSAADTYLIKISDFVDFALTQTPALCSNEMSKEGVEWLLRLIKDVAIPKKQQSKAA